MQNWIGGSDHHPLEADFVPPSPQAVPALMADLLDFMNGAAHAGLVQAAVTHAQFETIHPFTDGNGRVGRALIHTVLARRGLVSDAVLPVSLVLATRQQDYVDGLTAFRHTGEPLSTAAEEALNRWVTVFAAAVLDACDQSRRLAAELAELRTEWGQRLSEARRRRGARRALRADSAAAQILHDLPSTPVLTARTVERIYAVSHVAAGRALDELAEAGVLSTKGLGRGRTAFLATDVLDLLAVAERRLASTRFDTRVSPPVRPVPVFPAQGRRE